MSDIELVIKISEDSWKATCNGHMLPPDVENVVQGIKNGTPLPKGHGRLKDEDEIIKAIQDRVEFLKKNDAIFMRLRKDIDILGCIPKIRCEVSTIIEADKESEVSNADSN